MQPPHTMLQPRRQGASVGTRAYQRSLYPMPSADGFRRKLQVEVMTHHVPDMSALMARIRYAVRVDTHRDAALNHMIDSQTGASVDAPDANGNVAAFPPDADEAQEYYDCNLLWARATTHAYRQAGILLWRLVNKMMISLKTFDEMDALLYPERTSIQGTIGGWTQGMWRRFFYGALCGLHPEAHEMARHWEALA